MTLSAWEIPNGPKCYNATTSISLNKLTIRRPIIFFTLNAWHSITVCQTHTLIPEIQHNSGITEDRSGIIILFSTEKQMWPLLRTASMRQFCWQVTKYVLWKSQGILKKGCYIYFWNTNRNYLTNNPQKPILLWTSVILRTSLAY